MPKLPLHRTKWNQTIADFEPSKRRPLPNVRGNHSNYDAN